MDIISLVILAGLGFWLFHKTSKLAKDQEAKRRLAEAEAKAYSQKQYWRSKYEQDIESKVDEQSGSKAIDKSFSEREHRPVSRSPNPENAKPYTGSFGATTATQKLKPEVPEMKPVVRVLDSGAVELTVEGLMPEENEDDFTYQKPKEEQKDTRTIEFNYINAKGEESFRRVVLRNRDESTFTGICLENHAVRHFRYDRVKGDITILDTGEIVTASEFAGKELPPQIEQRPPVPSEPSTLSEAIEDYRELFESYGWVIQINKEEFGLYRRFKNGKLRKNPDVYLSYFELNSEGQKRIRPWYVRSNTIGEGKSYKYLHKAVATLLEYVEVSAEQLNLESAPSRARLNIYE